MNMNMNKEYISMSRAFLVLQIVIIMKMIVTQRIHQNIAEIVYISRYSDSGHIYYHPNIEQRLRPCLAGKNVIINKTKVHPPRAY
jgi:hypothetical protein